MKLVVSAQGETLDSMASPLFGRCPIYILVDGETMQFEALPNPAMNQGGGAGIQAAKFVLEKGAQAVLSGNVGPNAFDVLLAAGIPVYLIPEGTVRKAVEAFNSNLLQPVGNANVASHSGTQTGMSSGRGMGGGKFRAPSRPAAEQSAARESELTQLRDRLQTLRRDLAETMDQVDKLEREG